MSLLRTLEDSLRARPEPDPRDRAAAALAKLYARSIDANPDDPLVLARLGPKLFAILAALGLTLEARGTKTPPEAPDAQQQPAAAAERDPIDELERRRAERRGAAG